ncbi:immunity 42 family protein [Pantoea allii]|uniref:immunity 42 family protein n=1 Tax=Pantoea allii TaxID=574096 RepID=UPI0024B6AB25|nr:immunity 42 family protein [Pantoea allii]MDJ0041073.1 immunity 42 family protein [Pantoea allii]
MIFGDPYRFAIWVEHVPQWGCSYKNGLFYLVINGNLYPSDLRTSTLSTDLYEITDSDSALMSLPENNGIFQLNTKDAFNELSSLAYPEASEEDEYPNQFFDYCIPSSNISSFGGYFFAVASDNSLRIIGGVTEHLVKDRNEDRNIWMDIDKPLLEDIILPKDEIKKIMIDVIEYKHSLLK